MKKIVVGNHKMNLLDQSERERYLKEFKEKLKGKDFSETEIVICPSFVHLDFFARQKGKKKMSLGAQNMFPEKKGSYTGEISPIQLKNFGCEYVILGHSERRRYFSENNSEVNLKLISALENGLKPILCVGENKNEDMGAIARQLKECLADVKRGKIENAIFCYEPVWAISSNNPDHLPTTNEIMSARLLIRKTLSEIYGARIVERIKIIYGGSVASANAMETCVNSGMDGALVGRESLFPREFVKIAEIVNKN